MPKTKQEKETSGVAVILQRSGKFSFSFMNLAPHVHLSPEFPRRLDYERALHPQGGHAVKGRIPQVYPSLPNSLNNLLS
jgi:hypothetical protein